MKKKIKLKKKEKTKENTEKKTDKRSLKGKMNKLKRKTNMKKISAIRASFGKPKISIKQIISLYY